MRITNSMIFQNTMNNINRNVRHIHGIIESIESTKRIQRPSDDPLIAGRSLRFRTILSESEQFERNTELGLAWMGVSENTFNTILTDTSEGHSIITRLRTLLVNATTGTNQVVDRQSILEDIRVMFDQIARDEMNQTYMGRYVFSGFFSNEPPVLTADRPNRSFIIEQTFNVRDIERTLVMDRSTPNVLNPPINVNILKLPYTNVDFGFDTTAITPGPPATAIPDIGIFAADGTQFHIIERYSTDSDAYLPPSWYPDENDPDRVPVIHHVRDTGELVMSDAVRDIFQNGTRVVYEVRDLEAGELNPIVNFPTHEIVGTAPDRTSRPFDTAGHDIQLEISQRLHVPINSHARHILTDKMFADFRNLFAFADSLVPTEADALRVFYSSPPNGPDELGYKEPELTARVEAHLTQEQQLFASMFHQRLSSFLGLVNQHADRMQSEHTNLGSRMARFDMIAIRLEEETVMYTELLSDNEDTDIVEAARRRDAAINAFTDAMQGIARLTQLSLADFINR